MTMTIPNTYATANGTVFASGFDANWAAPATYVNAREIAFGTAAARPATGVSGQYYFATDTGVFSAYDAGAATWRTLSSVTTPVNYSVTGLTATTTATTYPASMNQALLVNPSTGGSQRATSVSVTNTITSATALNGTDGSALASGQWLHFYIIGNGSTTASVSSTVAPPTGPTLSAGAFAGYVNWAYLGAVWNTLNTGSLRLGYQAGASYQYKTAQSVLSGGSSAVEASISLTTIIPPNAGRVMMDQIIWANGTNLRVRIVTGVDRDVFVGNSQQTATSPTYPNVSQQIFYTFDAGGGSASMTVGGYTVPNGDA